MEYRIIERKFDDNSTYYPQYMSDKVKKYIIPADEFGDDRFSDYQFFTEWVDGSTFLQKITFSNMYDCKEFIQKQRMSKKHFKDIIHKL